MELYINYFLCKYIYEKETLADVKYHQYNGDLLN